jgi:UV DNA damage endonuclease
MKVRFGFVAMAMSLSHASPSQTITFKSFSAITDRDVALRKATRIASSNLRNTLRILRHAKASGVEVYRFSSKLIPLLGHEATSDWDFIHHLREEFAEIGDFVRSNHMRVSFHPDHYTLLNSPKPEIFHSSIRVLHNHVRMLTAMGLDERAKLVLHVGGSYRDKQSSLTRFASHFTEVPVDIQARLTLENDDKTFTAKETQTLCLRLNLPHVLDIHHHNCNHEEDSTLEDVVPKFLASWQGTELPPKAHMSSPKSSHEFRAHADYINPAEVLPFLDLVREQDTDIDVMLEAKQKDEAVFHLIKEMNKYDFVKVVNDGVIEYRP